MPETECHWCAYNSNHELCHWCLLKQSTSEERWQILNGSHNKSDDEDETKPQNPSATVQTSPLCTICQLRPLKHKLASICDDKQCESKRRKNAKNFKKNQGVNLVPPVK